MNQTNLDQVMTDTFTPLAHTFSTFVFTGIQITPTLHLPFVIMWLIVAAIFFTIYFRFINLWGLNIAFGILSGKYKTPSATNGEVSHFQALTTALSGTVGVGNIGAVAIAVSLGGPGAVFWLIVAGFCGMTTKFVECTLGITYRRQNPDGSVSGGPMFFLAKGLRAFPRLGKSLAFFYALGIIVASLGVGNMFQANQAYRQLFVLFEGTPSFITTQSWYFGLFFAFLVAIVIIGGIKHIAKVTEKLVPFMACLYISAALVVITMNYHYIPSSLLLIVKQAFLPEGIQGGLFAVVFWGFQRALLSNEAGIGSAAIAHAAVKSDEPYSEGFVSLLEPFIDTIVICTITSLVLVTSMQATPGIFEGLEPGVAMTSKAFTTKFVWASYPLAIIVILFAYSTIISWSYYGLKGWSYVFGETKISHSIFKLIYCFFVVIGCSLPVTAIIEFADATLFLLCIPNLIGLYLLCPQIKRDLPVAVKRLTKSRTILSTSSSQKTYPLNSIS